MARGFESAGVSSIWFGEYFQSALVRAGVAVSVTERVIVGTNVLQAFARSPLATSLAACDLQSLSGDRFVLGLGSQLRAANQRWHGVDADRPVAMLSEYVAAVRALNEAPEGETIRIRGAYWNLDVPGFRLESAASSPPIYVGGANLGTVRAAPRCADGLLGHLFWTPEHVSTVVLPALGEVRRKPFRISVTRLVAPDSVEGWEQDAARRLGHYAATGAYRQLLESSGVRVDPSNLLRALANPAAEADLVRLARPLIDRFCVTNAAGLRAERMVLGALGVDSVILFAPAGPGIKVDAASYERAAQRIVEEALEPAKS